MIAENEVKTPRSRAERYFSGKKSQMAQISGRRIAGPERNRRATHKLWTNMQYIEFGGFFLCFLDYKFTYHFLFFLTLFVDGTRMSLKRKKKRKKIRKRKKTWVWAQSRLSICGPSKIRV
jgi:hypothetical protein